MNKFKILIKDEAHFAEVQQALFAEGFGWRVGGKTLFEGSAMEVFVTSENEMWYSPFITTSTLYTQEVFVEGGVMRIGKEVAKMTLQEANAEITKLLEVAEKAISEAEVIAVTHGISFPVN